MDFATARIPLIAIVAATTLSLGGARAGNGGAPQPLVDREASPVVARSLAGCGNVLVTGDPSIDESVVRTFTRVDSGWTESTTLSAPPASNGFGARVATDGAVVAVAARHADVGDLSSAGAVYLYERTTSGWVPSDRITAPVPTQGEGFGRAVSLDSAVLAASTFNDEFAFSPPGVVYVYERSNSWEVAAEISIAQPNDRLGFGRALSVSGDRLAIGAPFDDLTTRSGRVHVYRRGSDAWELEQVLSADEPRAFAEFGRVVSLDDDRLAVGSRDGLTIFEFDGTWKSVLTARTPGEPPLGASVALVGDRLVAGRTSVEMDTRVEQFERGADGAWRQLESLCLGAGLPIAVVPELGGVAIAGDTVAARDHVAGRGPVALFVGGAGPLPEDPPPPTDLGGLAIERVTAEADVSAALDLGVTPFDPVQPVQVRVVELALEWTFELAPDGVGGFAGTRSDPDAAFSLTPLGPQGTHWHAALDLDPAVFAPLDPAGSLTLVVGSGAVHTTSRVRLTGGEFSFDEAPEDRTSPGVVIAQLDGRVRGLRRDRLDLLVEIGDADVSTPPEVVIEVGDKLRLRIPASAFRVRGERFVAKRGRRRRVRAKLDPAARTLRVQVRGAELGRIESGDHPLRVSVEIAGERQRQELLVRRERRRLTY